MTPKIQGEIALDLPGFFLYSHYPVIHPKARSPPGGRNKAPQASTKTG